MIITYSPEGGQKQVWDWKPDDILNAEAEAIEDVTDLSFDEIKLGLLKNRIKARRAVIWTLLKRENPTLRFRDVQFRTGEVEVEFDASERSVWRKAITDAPGMDEELREQALAVIDLMGGEPGDQPAGDTAAEAPKD